MSSGHQRFSVSTEEENDDSFGGGVGDDSTLPHRLEEGPGGSSEDRTDENVEEQALEADLRSSPEATILSIPVTLVSSEARALNSILLAAVDRSPSPEGRHHLVQQIILSPLSCIVMSVVSQMAFHHTPT